MIRRQQRRERVPHYLEKLLGSQFIDYWDPNYGVRADGGLVFSWTSVRGRVAFQNTNSLKPVYQSTGLVGRPGLFFDGADDYLSCPDTSGFPLGADPGEIWAYGDQQAGTGDSDATRAMLAYGGSANGTFREIRRSLVTSANRLRISQGASFITIADNYFGPQYIRGTFVDGAFSGDIMNGTEGTGAVSLATTSLRLRFGNTPNGTLTGWLGLIGGVLFVRGVTSGSVRDALRAYFLAQVS